MKKTLLAIAAMVLFSTNVMAADNKATTEAEAKPIDINEVSYAIGFSMGQNLKKQEIEFNLDSFVKGIQQGLAGEKGKYTEAEVREMIMNFQRQQLAKKAEQRKVEAVKNQKAGEEFLAKNKSQPGIVALPNGIQYKIIKEGNGEKPSADSSVTVEYTGKLIDGEVFDSSKAQGKPVTFQLNRVIKGWQEVLPLMKAGAEWEVFIPAALAYGERGTPNIGPNSTLIFNIQLMSVENNQDAKQDAKKDEKA